MSEAPDGILDTNTVILLPRITDPSVLSARPTITTITLAELSVGPLVATDEGERAARQALVQQAEHDFEPLPFDAAAARAFGRVAAGPRAAERTPKARAYDTLIASVAIATGLPLYTVNPHDFANIADLDLRPVPHPDAASGHG